MNLTPQDTVMLLTLAIYVIILHIFGRARKKFKGGNLELVIKLIIANNILLLAADYTYLLKFLEEGTVYILHTLLRLSAMCAIAFGGVRLVSPPAEK